MPMGRFLPTLLNHQQVRRILENILQNVLARTLVHDDEWRSDQCLSEDKITEFCVFSKMALNLLDGLASSVLLFLRNGNTSNAWAIPKSYYIPEFVLYITVKKLSGAIVEISKMKNVYLATPIRVAARSVT